MVATQDERGSPNTLPLSLLPPLQLHVSTSHWLEANWKLEDKGAIDVVTKAKLLEDRVGQKEWRVGPGGVDGGNPARELPCHLL